MYGSIAQIWSNPCCSSKSACIRVASLPCHLPNPIHFFSTNGSISLILSIAHLTCILNLQFDQGYRGLIWLSKQPFIIMSNVRLYCLIFLQRFDHCLPIEKFLFYDVFHWQPTENIGYILQSPFNKLLLWIFGTT